MHKIGEWPPQALVAQNNKRRPEEGELPNGKRVLGPLHPKYIGEKLSFSSIRRETTPEDVAEAESITQRYPDIEEFIIEDTGSDNASDFSKAVNQTNRLKKLVSYGFSNPLKTIQATHLTALTSLALCPLPPLPPGLPLILGDLTDLRISINPASDMRFIAGLHHLSKLSSLCVGLDNRVNLPALEHPIPNLRELELLCGGNQHKAFITSLLTTSLTTLKFDGPIRFDDSQPILSNVTKLRLGNAEHFTTDHLIRALPQLQNLNYSEALGLDSHLKEPGFLAHLTRLRCIAVDSLSHWVVQRPNLRAIKLDYDHGDEEDMFNQRRFDLAALTRLNNLAFSCAFMPITLLRQAIYRNQTHLAADIFKLDAHFMSYDVQVMNAFQSALAFGRTEIVKAMLKPKLLSLETPFDHAEYNGRNALLFVLDCWIKIGTFETYVLNFYENGYRQHLNFKTHNLIATHEKNDSDTPWSEAGRESLAASYSQILDLLLEAGARVSCTDAENRGPFHYAAAIGDPSLMLRLKVALDRQVQQISAPFFQHLTAPA